MKILFQKWIFRKKNRTNCHKSKRDGLLYEESSPASRQTSSSFLELLFFQDGFRGTELIWKSLYFNHKIKNVSAAFAGFSAVSVGQIKPWWSISINRKPSPVRSVIQDPIKNWYRLAWSEKTKEYYFSIPCVIKFMLHSEKGAFTI